MTLKVYALLFQGNLPHLGNPADQSDNRRIEPSRGIDGLLLDVLVGWVFLWALRCLHFGVPFSLIEYASGLGFFAG